MGVWFNSTERNSHHPILKHIRKIKAKKSKLEEYIRGKKLHTEDPHGRTEKAHACRWAQTDYQNCIF